MTIFRRTIATMLTGILATGPLFAAGHPAKTAKIAIQPKDAIRHVVVIFQENVSFDHYFGTYPHAANLAGDPQFTALPNTPAVDGLSGALLTANPNAANSGNGQGAANPFRLNRNQAVTADQEHNYRAEQQAYDNGKMDLFPKSVGAADGPKIPGVKTGIPSTTGLTMGYFDGNTVTAYWNYAQHFAMSDHSFNTGFGPSTPGVINLISGQTNGAINDQNASGDLVADGNGGLTLIGDADPAGDVCSNTSGALAHLTGPNIGDKLSAANITWGFFQGGFDLTVVNANGTTGCRRSSDGLAAQHRRDYVPHHQGFQYYASTANPQHTRPTSVAAIGTNGDGANHEYDTHDFFDALKAGNFPAVSFLKAPAYQDGHAGYSDPLDEQAFVVNAINAIQQSPDWDHTAVIIAYDDSDGWYDHLMGKIMNGSTSKADALTAPGQCADGSVAMPGVNPATTHAQGRCGFGPRLPLIVVSPWAKANFVDHSVTDQSSILRFVEDTFLNGARLGAGSFDVKAGPLNPMFDFSHPTPKNEKKLILNPDTGLVQQGS
jgi:phospholipase C